MSSFRKFQFFRSWGTYYDFSALILQKKNFRFEYKIYHIFPSHFATFPNPCQKCLFVNNCIVIKKKFTYVELTIPAPKAEPQLINLLIHIRKPFLILNYMQNKWKKVRATLFATFEFSFVYSLWDKCRKKPYNLFVIFLQNCLY
jgi:hypothetical protein